MKKVTQFIEGKKFLQVSTDEVYGTLERDIPEGQSLVDNGQLTVENGLAWKS